MHRFYIAPETWNIDSLTLDEDETHHAIDVLRMSKGDKAVVFNGRGAEATVEVAEITRKSVTLRKLLQSKSPAVGCSITLAQAVPKGKNMDLIVQKAVELGAAAICPLLSERTVIQVGEDDAALTAVDDAEGGLQGGEGVVADFGLGSADDREEA